MERLALTLGDIAGVGPEITLKVMKDYMNDIIVYGSYDVLDYYNTEYKYGYELNLIDSTKDFVLDKINIIDPLPIKMNEFEIGKLSKECGKRSYLYIEKAVTDALNQEVSGLVTCPLNKEALHMGGYMYAGHTEILADLTNTKSYAMLLWSNKLKTIHVSTHVSLLKAIKRVKKDRIIEVSKLAYDTLVQAGITNPSIAIAGLNPHAGENGLFGDEEIEEIIPAVNCLKQAGINVSGPIAPDTVFLKCLKGQYDLVVAMYHDQGHIPLKLLDFDGGVNVTVGLPIIRTSVDHGTAFDIAGSNTCNPNSLIQSIELAKRLSKQ